MFEEEAPKDLLPRNLRMFLLFLSIMLLACAGTWTWYEGKAANKIDHALFDKQHEIELIKEDISHLEKAAK